MPEKETFRNYGAHLRGTWSYIREIERSIAAVQSAFMKNRYEAVGLAVEEGLKVLAKKIGEEEMRQDLVREAESSKMLKAIHLANRTNAEIRKGIRELGIDRVIQISTEQGVDEEVARDIALEAMSDSAAYYDHAASWMESYLNDGEPRSVSEVKAAAIKAGMLPEKDHPDFKKKWSTMKAEASKKNLSGGKRGYWQKPRAEPLH